MSVVYQLVEFSLIVSYLIACVLYARLFFTEQQISSKLLNTSLVTSLGLHFGLILFLSAINKRCPLVTPGEALLFCSLLVGFAQYISEFFSRTKQLGIFTILPTAISVIVAVFMVSHEPSSPHKPLGLLFAFHIVFSLASYACYTIGTIIASMYILLYRKLKNKQFDNAFRKLPPLDKLETLMFVWTILGTLLMAAGSFTGRLWVKTQHANQGMSPLEWSIFIVMVIFVGALWFRKFRGLSSYKFAYTICVGFVLLLLSQIFGIHGF